MATLSRDYKLLFIHGRRTGSTAVREAMDRELGGENVPSQPVVRAGRTVYQRHATLPELLHQGYITDEQRRDLLVFTTVRNPFDDLVSLWRKLRAFYNGEEELRPEDLSNARRMALIEACGTKEFDVWVVERYQRPGSLGRLRSPTTERYPHTAGVDEVMRFERLQDDFDKLLARAGYPGRVALEHTNKTAGRERDYRRYYTPQARNTVQRAWAEDLERYGYNF